MSSPSPNFVALSSRINQSKAEFNKSRRAFEKANDKDDDEVEDQSKVLQNAVTKALRQVCDIAREGAREGVLSPGELSILLGMASDLEERVLSHADSYQDLFDFIPVSCGNDVKDEETGKVGLGAGSASRLLESMMRFGSMKDHPPSYPHDLLAQLTGSAGSPYSLSSKPSSLSTPLARFRSVRPLLPSSISPVVRAFSEARCEITCERIFSPTRLAICDSVLAIDGCGGWKDRDPCLELIKLTDDLSDGSDFGTSIDVGLASVANTMIVDESRRLVYVGDEDRIKSYRWAGEGDRGAIAVHTLDSDDYHGPLAAKQNGTKVVRAGRSGLAVWDIDGLPTHGPTGDRIVGKKIRRSEMNSWRDNDNDEIERSTGSPPTQKVAADALSNIENWTEHPNDSNSMIAACNSRNGVVHINLETKQLVSRYVGHSAFPSDIRTSNTDPHSFVTAARDGIVRLYDIRIPAPVLAVDHGDEVLTSALYEHIGGQPFLIFGGTKSEQVKVWDVRAKLPMYELSTGNNSVCALAWDEPRQTLFAATECWYMDRNGSCHGYRRAKFPRQRDPNTMERDDEDGDEEDEDEDDYDRCWPENAYHSETSFGYPLDSGEHRLYRYKFKPDPNVDILPAYGDANIDGSYEY